MIPASRLGKQIAEVAAILSRIHVPFALIGGLALASHNAIAGECQGTDDIAGRPSSDQPRGAHWLQASGAGERSTPNVGSGGHSGLDPSQPR